MVGWMFNMSCLLHQPQDWPLLHLYQAMQQYFGISSVSAAHLQMYVFYLNRSASKASACMQVINIAVHVVCRNSVDLHRVAFLNFESNFCCHQYFYIGFIINTS